MTQTLEQPPQPHAPKQIALLEVTPDVTGVQTVMVNAYFISTPDGWVLVDAGLKHLHTKIIAAAEQQFGRGAVPRAIILTHAHSDHIGGLEALLEKWPVPVFAHRLELPFLHATSSYPPGDPTVGNGLLSRVLPLLPQNKHDFGSAIRPLPDDGSVPMLPGWKWIHSPGHTPGHVSFFRESDRTLIVGDAFITRHQESLIATLTNKQHVHGPPQSMTPDWVSAEQSVKTLRDLNPAVAASGHGSPMSGEPLQTQLDELATQFRKLAGANQGSVRRSIRHGR